MKQALGSEVGPLHPLVETSAFLGAWLQVVGDNWLGMSESMVKSSVEMLIHTSRA